MVQQLFFVNDHFSVDSQLGMVKDTRTGQETRLEPRIMQLFCLLAANAGKLVSREYLVKTIWDDYGSADEGLTQAISYLRKVFNDQEKKLIETVPKKGYLLHAAIAKELTSISSEISPVKRIKPLYWVITTAVLLLVLVYFIFMRTSRPSFSPDVVGSPANTEHPNTGHPDTASKKSSDLK